jgi:hypothetical protein
MATTARFIDFRFWISDFRLVFALCLLVIPARADERSTLLSAPKLPPYQWFASTDPKHRNADYIPLKPGESRRVPLAKGVLLRLWSTALEPENIELYLQNGARVELLKNSKAKLGNYYEKAYTFYPDASTPPAARDLKKGAAIVVVNKSKSKNKWFYQAAVREKAQTAALSATNFDWTNDVRKTTTNFDWTNIDPEIARAGKTGLKLFELPAGTKSNYELVAAYGSARSQRDKPIPILSVTGEGTFVGLVLDIRPAPDTTRRTFAFLEGNETIIADGKKYEGTGTEDFFNSAWYFPEKPFSQKYHGLTFKGKEPPRVTAYRWMIPDAVPFKNNFKFEFEHGNGNNGNDLEYRWVAFWYQKPDAKFEIADELKGGSSTASTPSGSGASGGQSESTLLPIFAALTGIIIVGVFVMMRRARR